MPGAGGAGAVVPLVLGGAAGLDGELGGRADGGGDALGLRGDRRLAGVGHGQGDGVGVGIGFAVGDQAAVLEAVAGFLADDGESGGLRAAQRGLLPGAGLRGAVVPLIGQRAGGFDGELRGLADVDGLALRLGVDRGGDRDGQLDGVRVDVAGRVGDSAAVLVAVQAQADAVVLQGGRRRGVLRDLDPVGAAGRAVVPLVLGGVAGLDGEVRAVADAGLLGFGLGGDAGGLGVGDCGLLRGGLQLFLAEDDDLLLVDGDQLDLLGPCRQIGQGGAEHDQAEQQGQASFHPVIHLFSSSCVLVSV